MNLLRHLLKPRASRPSPVERDDPRPDDGADDMTYGWYDSSHELRRGLDVVELDPALVSWPDTLPIAWPLGRVASSVTAVR